jgi:hypothetical protein
MTRFLIVSALLCPILISAQDLNWNTVSYTTGSLSTNFGSIGSPATTVSLNITGNTNRIDAGFPIKYTANPSGMANDCAVNCAVRSSVTFTALNQSVVYTFSFSPTVTGLSFRIYDIDGTDAASGDQAVVTAVNVSTQQNITMTTSAGPTITGSGTTTATARGTQGNTTDDFVDVSITSGITSVSITYVNNPNNPSAGNRSFSIGNMNWSGVLPVKWVSFTGNKLSNGGIQLKWITEDEINGDKYIIERSKDGQNFQPIAEQVIRNSSGATTYSYTDPFPGGGNTLYRIRQQDIDGRYSYSGIVLIREKNDLATLFVYPNPAKELLYIALPGNVQVRQVKITDATGRTIISGGAITAGRLSINTLQPGLYTLQVENTSGEIFTTKFVKE